MNRLAILRNLVFVLCAAASSGAWAIIGLAYGPVEEFVNDGTGHYLLLFDPYEISEVVQGKAGPGWRRTGFSFDGYKPYVAVGGIDLRPVCRFYSHSQNSHFYTADARECADLKADGRGWVYEKSDFQLGVPANGSCGSLQPVWRFYNNRWMFNDSNHRYSADPGQAAKMRAKGWIDEGIAFCTTGAHQSASQLYALFSTNRIRPGAECENEAIGIGPCIALNRQPELPNEASPYFVAAFTQITGTGNASVYTAYPVWDSAAVAAHSFVQGGGGDAQGIHVSSADRTSGQLTSINPLFQFHTNAPAGGEIDPRVFPWRDDGPNELVINFELLVKILVRGDSSSAAYGHPAIEFIDSSSGEHLYVTLQAYGTMPSGDFVARDVDTGRVIVSTAFRADPAFGTRYAGDYIECSGDVFGGTCPGVNKPFRFGIDRAAFAKVLALARTANIRLSAEPADYLIRNFHFKNEVYREGRIGVSLRATRLEIFDR